MRRNPSTTLSSVALALAGMLSLAGCDLEVANLNNPGLDELEDEPTPSKVASACTGLLIGTRAGTAAAIGYVSQLGILGRESYNFDAADPRNVGEMLAGQLSPASPYGGAFWGGPYTNIRLANITLAAAAQVPEFTPEEQTAIKGYIHTIQALDLWRVITTRDTIGAVIDTDRPIDELGEIVPKDEVYTYIADLLDTAADELAGGGDAFPFPLTSGFSGFDDPAGFLTFNRALRARVAAYQEDYAGIDEALAESFIDDAGDLDVGPKHTFGTGTGDVTNGLINPNIYAHQSLVDDAQANGDVPDARLTAKVTQVDEENAGGAGGLSSDLKFTMYSPTAPVPIIRNEELILLRAEAAWGQGDLAAAIADLNIIRTVSGGLAPLADDLSADEVEEEILYNRRYSLMFEGGHRWLDARRFGRIEDIPLDLPEHFRNVRYPIPAAECDGRPGEAACEIGSQD
jgi:starch-binding outer membrane protein, SusD/RagB family